MKSVEIPKWLEKLPLAPEFHPTDTEFADPIAYISKIEKEASTFGICKIIPPFPKPSRKYVLQNLNKSLSKCPELDPNVSLVTRSNSDTNAKDETKVNVGESRAVFTTRQQELGCEKGKKDKGSLGDPLLGAQKHVWQSGEIYTLEQFEAKSKNFTKSQLGSVKDVNPLVVETMFWKANSEKPIYVEYANDVPGSGFGEPEGLLKYFHRRRRKRKRNSFGQNKLASSNINKDQVGLISSAMTDKDSDNQNPDTCIEEARNSSETGQSHESASISGRNSFQCSSEMEGTAGWKLSNSPWNLQVIARSPGSLTRFMPDDIPGVTSPMVYVGMLYSWFAWHVEDHELHSLNFLHMGSSKTWYAVPADYALEFEEVVRLHVFGKDTDRLVALSLLGEKTTVLSPETIVASGLPCCRLVQNPGEFVVTFPRAYHVGFSHGFNCGEAANFGTPKWLTIAKKAAVRRAAMNHLPMLSHQQLLYLLTMSFLSRIPRSLLPGVRSSRLRDRQKEHRELLVKRAFIEDILHENSQLNVLLQRNSAYRTVLWDVESLLSLRKEPECCKDTDVVMLTSEENNCPENVAASDRLSQLSEFIGGVDFDLYDDDLAYDFETESGTLPCVACGILGFPFMAVVQPSEEASRNLFHLDLVTASVEPAESSKDAPNNTAAKSENCCVNEALSLGTETSQTTRLAANKSVVADQCTSSNCESVSSKIEVTNGWNISNLSLRPRIFCLEHAIQVEELLSLKGGANVIVICHSDFQKIVTHAGMISEEIGVPFSYTEVPLDNASKEDLNLIDISIEREDQDNNSAEDWTSELCVNLRHYVKVKRSSLSSKNVRHLMDLGGLFSAAPSISKASDVEWISRKLRSNRRQNLQSKPLDRNKVVEDDLMKTNKELQIVSMGGDKIIKEDEEKKVASNGDAKIIQYSRRRFKSCTLSGKETPTCLKEADKEDEIDGRSLCSTVANNGETSLDPSSQALDTKAGSHCGDTVLLSEKGSVEDHFPSNCIDTTGVSTAVIENLEAHPKTCVVYRSEEVAGSCCESQLKISGKMNGKDKNSLGTDELASNENVKECPDVNGVSREEETVDESGGACKSHSTERDSEVSDNTKFDNQLVINQKELKCSTAEECELVRRDSEYTQDIVSECALPINESISSLNEANLRGEATDSVIGQNDNDGESAVDEVLDDLSTVQSKITEKAQRKRKREVKLQYEDHFDPNSFIRSPCEGLRPRTKASSSSSSNSGTLTKKPAHETQTVKKPRKATDSSTPSKDKKVKNHQYKCGIDTCTMSFRTKSELRLHEGNQCPVDGCRKKFNSHKYAVQHQRVHEDDRPLKCPWKGCTVSFKWAWARTEHLRVHTGERPYECKVDGCGLTFRFVSDFSRHRRKTGHYVD